MLKDEKIKVVVLEGFTVEEVFPQDAARQIEDIKEKFPKLRNLELAEKVSCEKFVDRVTAWPFDQPCDAAHKAAFFQRYTEKANKILEEAEEKITAERDERLGNLFTGASGDV